MESKTQRELKELGKPIKNKFQKKFWLYLISFAFWSVAFFLVVKYWL